MRHPGVSIIILNYNGSKDTKECLESLENQTYKNFEIILVDNGSREDDFNQLRQFVERSSLKIKLVGLKENKGFTGGNNIAVKHCKGEYIVCLNNDIVVEDNWLENLVKPFSQDNEKIAAVGSLIKNYYDREKVDYSGGKINIFGQVKAFTKDEISHKKVFTLPGASFIIKKQILKEIEPLFCPEFFPGYYEEIDLSWRLYNLGYKISVVLDSIVYHKRGASSRTKNSIKRKRVSFIRNKYLTFYRNLPTGKFLLIFPVLIIWDFIIILRYLNRAKIKIKGILEFFKNMRKVKHIGNGNFSFLDKRRYRYI